LRSLRWGLVPSWSKDASGGARMINARLETLLEKGAFKRAALSRRCLVPADGWYEWQVSPTEKDAKGKPRKQPFFIHLADGAKLAFGGVYEFWRDAAAAPDDPEAWLTTFAVITMAAEPGLDTVHDRMPLVLPSDRWAPWLDPTVKDAPSVHDLTEGLPAGRFAALPVSTRVNSVRNDGPELLAPAPMESLVGVVDPATGELIGGHIEEHLF
jgi:putative SOS response-associated peptidase YedK